MDVHPTTNDGDGGGPTLAQPGITKYVCKDCRKTLYTDNAVSICECGGHLILTAATGETIEQAIKAAAQELPDRTEPVQPTIPGLRPAFDEHAALDLIEEAAREAELAEAASEGAKAIAKRKREAADTANAHLRELIRDLNHRRHDARYEPPSESAADVHSDRGEAAEVLQGDVSSGEESLPPDRDHRDATDGDVQAVQNADHVADCSNVGTLKLLHQAGATNITLHQVDVWTEEQVVLARAWAEEQIEANETAASGTHVSVLWPAHVSLAHHGPEFGKHTPKARPKKRATRRRSR